MEHQRTLNQYDAGGEANITDIIDDLEETLRKEGFSGERAYKVLCDLLVIKSYYERNNRSLFHEETSKETGLKENVQNILEREAGFGEDSEFASEIASLSESRLEACMKILEGLSLEQVDIDIFGFFYGRFFSDVFRGESGKFFTPREVVSAMVQLGDPREGEVICDPACGSGGFLVRASKMLEDRQAKILGNDNDPILAKTTRSNLYIAGESNFQIQESDLFDGEFIEEHRESQYLILANPPFSLKYEVANVWDGYENFDGMANTISDYLFLESAQHLLKPSGRLVSLFPMSMITNSDHEHFRKMLRDNWSELACITLPEGVFYPYSGTSAQACILMLVKDQKNPYYQYPSLKVNINKLGYDTSRKKYTPIEQNDFNDLFTSEEYEQFKDIRGEVIGS
jgi:type I restriction-modification system DNA methylase subunit